MLKDLMMEIADEQDIEIREVQTDEDMPVHYCMQISGTNMVMEGHAMEAEGMFIFYVIPGAAVPKEKLEQISWILMQRNYLLKLAKWYIDPASRLLTVRAEQYLDGDEETQKNRIIEIITACGTVADTDYMQIVKMM